MTTDAKATCIYCGGEYAAARAEIGFAYCMEKPCTARGKEAKAAGGEVEAFEWTAADTARF